MSKEENKDKEFDFNIGDIFGEFEQETSKTKLDEPDIPELPEDLEKEIKDKSKEVEDDDSDESVEDTEDSDEEDIKDKEDIEDSNDYEESDEDKEYSYKALASYLAEQGVIDFEDSEDVEDTPELLEEAVLNTAKNMVKEYKESIPEEGKLFLEYLEKGGDPKKYLKTLEQPLDFDNLDLEDISIQKKVVSELLKNQGYSDDEITESLQDYEDGLILEKQAKIASRKLEKIYSKQKEQLVAQQEAELEERNKALTTYINDIKNTINSSDSLGGLKVSGSDKKEFEKYLLEKDKTGLTQYEKDLQDNPTKTQVELAYLKFKKFNFKALANKVKTEETKRIKGLIKSKENTVKGNSRKVESTEDKADFSAFKFM